MSKLAPLVKVSLVALLCLAVCPVQAQELRIETDIFAEEATEPLSHTVTLFDGSVVYNIVDSDHQVTVFRPPTSSRHGQFVLLDIQNRRRTEVTTDKISSLMEKLTKWAAAQDDELLQFAAKPEFEEKFDSESGQLTLDSEAWSYTAATIPAENPQALSKYRQFTDWYAQLNVMLHSTPPAGPRLALNAALEKYGVVPVEIRRTLDSQSTSLRATHLISWRLSREDRNQIEQIQQHLANFEKVDNKAFLASLHGEEVVRGQSK